MNFNNSSSSSSSSSSDSDYYDDINNVVIAQLAINQFYVSHYLFNSEDSHDGSESSSDQSPSHNVFVYGGFQEPAVVGLILECTPVIVSAQLHGYHLYRLKGRLHPCISPSENGVINGKILTGLTDAQLENLDMIGRADYERKTVEVVLTDTSEKMNVQTYVWANKDDPDMYGEWDFEEWKRLHMEKFIEASKKFMEWKKNPDGRSR